MNLIQDSSVQDLRLESFLGNSLPAEEKSHSNSPNINYDLNARNGRMRYRNTAMGGTSV